MKVNVKFGWSLYDKIQAWIDINNFIDAYDYVCNVRIVNLIWKMREHLATLFKSLFDPLASTFEMVPITSAPQFLAMSCFRSAVFRLDLWRNSGWLGPDILQFAFHTWAAHWEILHSDTFTTATNPLERSGDLLWRSGGFVSSTSLPVSALVTANSPHPHRRL